MGKKVCVVGGGCSGIASVKQLLDEGHEPHCFEMKDDLGGVFYDFRGGKKESIVYDNTILTISNQSMAFSDFPPLGEGRNHWHWAEYTHYLKRYVKHFNLGAHMQFNKQVLECRHTAEGKWRVTVQDTDLERAAETHVFDALMVCSGTHRVPKRPTFEGEDAFIAAGGRVLHSSTYKSPEPFKGQRVVVIGCGESGADVVRELGVTALATTLAVRTLPVIIPRNVLHGRYVTTDGWDIPFRFPHSFEVGYGYALGAVFAVLGLAVTIVGLVIGSLGSLIGMNVDLAHDTWKEARNERLRSKCSEDGRMAAHSLDVMTPDSFEARKLILEWRKATWDGKGNVQNKFFTKNASFVPLVVDGTIKVKTCGFSRLEPGKMVFEDGEEVEADVVMCCTGYQDRFEFLSEELGSDRINVRTLFKHSVHPDYDNLALIGWARPASGGIPACSELQARLFSLKLSGKVRLPEGDEMKAAITADREREDAQFKWSPGVNTVVSYFDYAPAMAKLIGCFPNFWCFVRDPYLFYRFLCGGHTPSWWRLSGPHAVPELAAAHIKNIPLPLGYGANVIYTVPFMAHFFGFRGRIQSVADPLVILSYLMGWKTVKSVAKGFGLVQM